MTARKAEWLVSISFLPAQRNCPSASKASAAWAFCSRVSVFCDAEPGKRDPGGGHGRAEPLGRGDGSWLSVAAGIGRLVEVVEQSGHAGLLEGERERRAIQAVTLWSEFCGSSKIASGRRPRIGPAAAQFDDGSRRTLRPGLIADSVARV